MFINDVIAFVAAVVAMWGPQINTLLGLIAANVVFGVALAIKNKEFDWSKFSNFYISDILPKLIGYIGVVILVEFTNLDFLGPEVKAVVEDGIQWTAWLAVVVSLGGDILNKLSALGIGILSRIPGIE